MPRYNLRLGGRKVTVANTSEPISSRLLDRGQPQTVTDSGGSMGRYSWQGQELDRSELRKVKQIREKGGIIASLFDKKALIRFGGGAELQAEDDDLQAWLEDNYQQLDLTVLDLGLDATYYPYGVGENVETRGGDYSHVEFVEPWTILPRTNEYGEIVVWEQETDGMNDPTPFQPDEIGSIVINKSAARDKVGVSEVLRNEEEITEYKQHQQAIDKAIEIAGFPHHVWTVGAEGRSPVDDNDLRRVRNLIDNMDGDTQFVVGPDVEHDKITPSDFDFENITKRDLRILTTAIGLPFEVAGYGREGMGSGSETDLISDLQSLENRVARRRFETQFVEEFVRPAVRDYSPYDHEQQIELVISPFRDETDDIADLIDKIGDYMTNEQVMDRLDLPPIEDDEIAESYRPPKQIEEAEEEDQQDDGMGGIFGEKAEQAVDAELENRDLSEGLTLVDDSTPDFDRHYLRLFETGVGSKESDKLLVSFSESGVPEMVQERMRDVIMGGALFSDFENIPSSDLMELRTEFANMLTEDGWTTDILTEQIQELEPQLEDYEAERIARTETQHIVNESRKQAYQERGLEEAQFKWVGTDDHRNAEFDGVKICREIAERTDPKLGGTPRTLEELDELIQEIHSDLGVNTSYREFTPHINCRHTYVRHIE